MKTYYIITICDQCDGNQDFKSSSFLPLKKLSIIFDDDLL